MEIANKDEKPAEIWLIAFFFLKNNRTMILLLTEYLQIDGPL